MAFIIATSVLLICSSWAEDAHANDLAVFDDIVDYIVDEHSFGKIFRIVYEYLQCRLVYVSLAIRAKGAARADFTTHLETCLCESPLYDLVARRALLP
jgi:hypothetical protein